VIVVVLLGARAGTAVDLAVPVARAMVARGHARWPDAEDSSEESPIARALLSSFLRDPAQEAPAHSPHVARSAGGATPPSPKSRR
jgi:hypothetical protein